MISQVVSEISAVLILSETLESDSEGSGGGSLSRTLAGEMG